MGEMLLMIGSMIVLVLLIKGISKIFKVLDVKSKEEKFDDDFM